jgi:hypothetical protein
VYIVWAGTDIDGKYLKSSSLRMSRFLAWGVDPSTINVGR